MPVQLQNEPNEPAVARCASEPDLPRSVDLGGRAHSPLSRYWFVARQIRGFSLIAHRRHFETLATLKAERA